MNNHRFLLPLATAAVVAVAAAPAGGHQLSAAKTTKCSGKAEISQLGLAFGFANEIDAHFSCNKSFKKFTVSTSKKLDGSGLANESFKCKQDGSKRYKCSGAKAKAGQDVQTSFATKASHPCSGTALKVKVSAAGKTFTLKGPC